MNTGLTIVLKISTNILLNIKTDDIDESEINKVISTDLGIVADCKKYSKLYLKDLQIKLP